MFLLPSILLGLVFALLLGGRLARLADIHLRAPSLVLGSLAAQLVLFSRLGAGIPARLHEALHLASYALLIVFAGLNLRVRALAPVLLGMALNAVAIAANGGSMPVSPSAADAAGITAGASSNVSETATHLRLLGDVFALPEGIPLANAFSIGDILIAFGIAAFIVTVSLGGGGPATLDPRRLLQPFRARPYRRLATGRIVSHLGDWLTLATLVAWVFEQTGSTGHVAAVIICRLAPPILGGSLAAVLVDRLPKHRVLVTTEALRGLAVAAALLAVHANNQPGVFAALSVSGLLAAFGNATAPALLPSLLPAEVLPAANAALGMAKDASMGLGALGAGLILTTVGAQVALTIDLATFAIAIVAYGPLRALPSASRPARTPRGRVPAIRYVLGRRTLVTLILAFAAATLATGLTNASLPRFLTHHAELGSGGYGYGLAAVAGGLTLGQALVGFTRIGPTAGRWIGAALLLMAGLLVLLAQSSHTPTILLFLAAVGFVDGTTDVIFDTAIQRQADHRYLGSIFGAASALITTTMMGAVALAPVLNDHLRPGATILAAAGALVLAGTVAVAGQNRHRRLQPAPSSVDTLR